MLIAWLATPYYMWWNVKNVQYRQFSFLFFCMSNNFYLLIWYGYSYIDWTKNMITNETRGNWTFVLTISLISKMNWKPYIGVFPHINISKTFFARHSECQESFLKSSNVIKNNSSSNYAHQIGILGFEALEFTVVGEHNTKKPPWPSPFSVYHLYFNRSINSSGEQESFRHTCISLNHFIQNTWHMNVSSWGIIIGQRFDE